MEFSCWAEALMLPPAAPVPPTLETTPAETPLPPFPPVPPVPVAVLVTSLEEAMALTDPPETPGAPGVSRPNRRC